MSNVRNSSSPGSPPAIDIVERALFQLRDTPAGIWAVQAAGAVPLLLSVLYFAFDMTSGGTDSNPVFEALLCAICFLWFNVCRTRFAQLLWGALSEQTPPRLSAALDPVNLAIQTVKLFAMPLALIAAIPLGWCVAFFRTAGVYADSGVIRRGGKAAGIWPRQTWAVVGILGLLSAVVFINLLVVIAASPSLIKIATGSENEFTRLGFVFNGTSLSIAAGLTWLLVDPLYQAAFCVRAFLVESRGSGLDLVVSLRHLAVVILLMIFTAPFAGAQTIATVPTRVTPAQLDASIDKVLDQREYAWHLPRVHDSKPGALDGILDPIRRAYHKVGRWIGELLDRLFRINEPTLTPNKPAPFPAVQLTMVVLVVLFAAALGFAFVRFARTREAAPPAAPALMPREIALENEGISAADLPEDQWMAMGRECLARNDYRLAIRAYYLASLSWLGRNELLTVAPFKSNRDYRRELRRRAHNDALESAFANNMGVFERAWYGVYPVSAEEVDGFIDTLSKMKTSLGKPGYAKT